MWSIAKEEPHGIVPKYSPWGSSFCDRPNLTPSDSKFILYICTTLTTNLRSSHKLYTFVLYIIYEIMRRFIALLSVVLLTLIGCSRELPPLQFALDKYDVEIPAEGGAVEVRVMSNQPWELTGYTTWCEPSIKSGVGRAEGEVVTFTAESASYDRSVTYRFCAGGESFELRVT